MRNSSGAPQSATTFTPLGMDGGGFVTSIDVATDGTMVCRNDTINAHVLPPGATKWVELFQVGITYPASEQVFKNPLQRCYAIGIAPSNSQIIYAFCMGKMWKTTNQGGSWTKLTGFKSGNLDTTFTDSQIVNQRLGGQHIRVSPTNPNNVGFFHPVDGFYYSTDGGTTWTLSASILASTSVVGGCVQFVSDTEVWVVSGGRGTYRSTTGVGGTFALVGTGYPTAASAMAAGGGKVYIIGDGAGTNTQLYVWSGSAWVQPSGVIALGVDVKPGDSTKVLAQTAGGDQFYSTDTGVTFSSQANMNIPHSAGDIPYLAWTVETFFSLGYLRWHPTLGPIVAEGIGVWYMTGGPPQSVSTSVWNSLTLGIRQLLPMDITVTSDGAVLVPVQDRAGVFFERANAKLQACRHVSHDVHLPMGGGMDYAADNTSYWVCVYVYGKACAISKDRGKTWTEVTQPSGYAGGNVAMGNSGNIVWVPTNNTGVPVYSTDGGTTWTNCVFLDGGNNPVTTGANVWSNWYVVRRKILAADKTAPGTFYVYCVGTGVGDAADLAMLGTWKSTDGGATWHRIISTHWLTHDLDYYQCRLRPVPGRPTNIFWCRGTINSYPTAPAADGLYFWDGTAIRTLPGWNEPYDIALGAPCPGYSYPALYVLGWRTIASTLTYGLYRAVDFNPATYNPTWVLLQQWPMGRPDWDCVIGADPNVFGRGYIGFSAGGGAVFDYDFTLTAS